MAVASRGDIGESGQRLDLQRPTVDRRYANLGLAIVNLVPQVSAQGGLGVGADPGTMATASRGDMQSADLERR